MRIDPWRARLLAAGLSLSAAAGCAAPSAASDLGRIRELSRLDLPSSTASEEVEPATTSDARPLLSRPLTADAAVRVALLNNRELRATLREVGVARGNLVQAGVLPNPELEVQVTPRQGTLEHTRVELGVEFDLTSAILAPLGERAARADHEAARYRAAGAVVELGYSVRAAFYAAQATQQRLALANRALDAFAAARDAARALFEAGNVPELDVATQEAGYEAARVAVAGIELELLDRREQLQRLLGLSGAETSWRIADEIPRPPEKLAMPPRPEARALSASLELAELRSRLESAAGRAGLARTAGWLPDLSVGVRGEREDEAWQIGAGLRLTLPLFDRKQGATMAHTAEFDSLLERYHGRAIDVRSAVRAAQNRLASAHARVLHHQRVLVPARTRVLEQTLLQYNAMQAGVFELLQARRGQLDAELAQVDALRDYWTSRAAFDAILAGRRVEVMGTIAPAPMSGAAESGGGH